MRIALVGPAHPYKGGGARHTTELAHRLAAAGHDVIIESWRAQYPSRLYPGQQTVDVPEGAPYPRTRRRLAWYRPDGWLAEGRRLRPADLVVFALLTPLQVPPYLAIMSRLGRGAASTGPHRGHLPQRPPARAPPRRRRPHPRPAQARGHGHHPLRRPGRPGPRAGPGRDGADRNHASPPARIRLANPGHRTGRGIRLPTAHAPALLRHRPPVQGPGRPAARPGEGPAARHAHRRRRVLGRYYENG